MTDQPRRVHFIEGMLLSAADLAAEQQYHREMRHLHNRLHGYGTVSGLEVTVTKGGIQVGPGMAVDSHGREIVVSAPMRVPLDSYDDTQDWVRDLVIAWNEIPSDPVPGPDGEAAHTRWIEQPELDLVSPGEPSREGLVLARLVRTGRDAVEVDLSVRRPLGPA